MQYVLSQGMYWYILGQHLRPQSKNIPVHALMQYVLSQGTYWYILRHPICDDIQADLVARPDQTDMFPQASQYEQQCGNSAPHGLLCWLSML